jgi:hypothetical protein
MTQEETLYHAIGQQLDGAVSGQLFGKPCYKTAGKAFICLFQQCMVFKLSGPVHAEALALEGAILFDPSGRGRAMKEWVQLPYAHAGQWQDYAAHAIAYVHNAAKA